MDGGNGASQGLAFGLFIDSDSANQSQALEEQQVPATVVPLSCSLSTLMVGVPSLSRTPVGVVQTPLGVESEWIGSAGSLGPWPQLTLHWSSAPSGIRSVCV